MYIQENHPSGPAGTMNIVNSYLTQVVINPQPT